MLGALGLFTPHASARDQSLTFSAPAGAPSFVPPAGAPVIGTAQISDNPKGPDVLAINITLAPNTRYTVFQGGQPTGGLHTQLLGEFTTDGSGKGFFFAVVEIINHRASANIDPDFSFFGVQGLQPLSGALANDPATFRLPYLRIYEAVGNTTVFGGTVTVDANGVASSPGGRNVATTNQAIALQ